MSTFDLNSQQASLGAEDQATLALLERLGQTHLLVNWPAPGSETESKQRLLAQVRSLDAGYPGGLGRYLENARQLLEAQKAGKNPYEGFRPNVPTGHRLAFKSEAFVQAEQRAEGSLHRVGYVLVAGGLGERLGYSGIKVSLPAETATMRSYLELYAQQILAFEALANRANGETRHSQLLIMTSDDTHTRTCELLEQADFFGLSREHVTLLKQDKVPSLGDDRPSLVLRADDPYQVETKPHGHGDVHTLLYQSGLARRWQERGIEWVVFFQDTNGLALHVVPATIGVSRAEDLEVNSVAVPRRAGEAVGGIARLEKPGRSLTINVEYSQLDAMLKANDGTGDVANATGYSPYPGNINLLVFRLAPYLRTLEKSAGAMPEFVNPKYADADRSVFSKPTRLECMMQDYPKLLSADARVGFTEFEREVCFSGAKNDLNTAASRQQQGLPPEAASTAEADLYALHRRYLANTDSARLAREHVETFGGVEAALFPIVVLSPSLTAQPTKAIWRLENINMSSRSTLLLLANDPDAIEIDGLELDGALVVRAAPGVKVRIRGLSVKNDGWEAAALSGDDQETEVDRMRGFFLVRHATRLIEPKSLGEHVIEE